MEPLCGQLLLCQEERWQTPTGAGLSTAEQMDKEKPQCVASNSISSRQISWMHPVHQI